MPPKKKHANAGESSAENARPPRSRLDRPCDLCAFEMHIVSNALMVRPASQTPMCPSRPRGALYELQDAEQAMHIRHRAYHAQEEEERATSGRR